ncbi:MAG: tRNA lysidine(34) synthetase TilS [Proteobacteria bacterium]|nr:tRNA lysidine(34) synthetase TilS [Pseudomonadota bacterium]
MGPFEPAPRLAVAVSGGPDSLALALLAQAWVVARGGALLGVIINHGLRAAAASEAAEAQACLARIGMPARIVRLTDLARGPGLAARARLARYAALEAVCGEAGIVHLLLGHHAGDQAETMILRALGGSGPAGLAGMAALAETSRLRWLRPLLDVPPARLRATLRAAGLGWAEDPSNADPTATRARLRALRADRAGTGPATRALCVSAAAAGAARAAAEASGATLLAAHATFRPEGFALLDPAPLPAAALGALIQAVAGSDHPPRSRSLAALAAAPRPATLGGVRFLPAGRLAPGRLLLVREEARLAPPVAAAPGAVWDGRFRVVRMPPQHAGPYPLTIGALGPAAAWRARSGLPAAVLRTLPALFGDGSLLAVPHLGYHRPGSEGFLALFAPARPAFGAPFRPVALPR